MNEKLVRAITATLVSIQSLQNVLITGEASMQDELLKLQQNQLRFVELASRITVLNSQVQDARRKCLTNYSLLQQETQFQREITKQARDRLDTLTSVFVKKLCELSELLMNQNTDAITCGLRNCIDFLRVYRKELMQQEKTLETCKNEQYQLAEQSRPQSLLSSSLQQTPFLVMFHRSNNKDVVNSILALQSRIPELYRGRRIEYAFETDFFWIEHEKKAGQEMPTLSVFLGHAVHGLIPWKGWMLKRMKYGEGLMRPDWLFSVSGKIKMCIEIKTGWGNDTRALDQLIELIRQNRVENSIVFYALSVWVLQYLKQRLPNSLTILYCNLGLSSESILSRPFNRPFETLKKWGIFPSISKLGFVDALALFAKNSTEQVAPQVASLAHQHKYFFARRIWTKQQFDCLVDNGARGGLLFTSPEELLKWFSAVPKDKRKD